MPAPIAAYLAASATAVAAGYVLYQYVYEPHIAPVLERLAEDFLERREAARRERERRAGGLADPVSEIPLNDATRARDRARHRRGNGPRGNDNTGNPPPGPVIDQPPARQFIPTLDSVSTTGFTPQEVDEWRNAVRLRTSLRRRLGTQRDGRGQRTGTALGGYNHDEENVWAVQTPFNVLDEPNQPIPQTPLRPIHVVIDSNPTTPTSTVSSSPSGSSPHRQQSQGQDQRVTPPAQVSPLPRRPGEASNNNNNNNRGSIVSFTTNAAPSVATMGTNENSLEESLVMRVNPFSDRTLSPLSLPLHVTSAVGPKDDRGNDVMVSQPSTPPRRRSGSSVSPASKLRGRALSPQAFQPLQFQLQPTTSPTSSVRTPQAPRTNPNRAHPPIPSLSQVFPISLDQEQGIELVSHPSSKSDSGIESEHDSVFSLGSEFDLQGHSSPSIQLSPPPLQNVAIPVLMTRVNVDAAGTEPGSVPTVRLPLRMRDRPNTPPSPRSPSSSSMFYSFTNSYQTNARSPPSNVFSPTLSELELSSDDDRGSNGELGSESSWTSAKF
ncbi:hypothetical protein AX15_003536 [Amanita polypyramis BW_CC]|nr:hypothetical protein AX15_003536 [Amanita polypyramis BW_CC]